MKMSSTVGVRKYLTEYYFLRVHTFYYVLWSAFSLYALIPLWQKTAVNLHTAHKKTDLCAAHEALLVCFLLLCITRIITHVQHMKKVNSRVAHFVLHACFDSRHDKNWRTHACSSHASVNLDMSCTVNDTNYFTMHKWHSLCNVSVHVILCIVFA